MGEKGGGGGVDVQWSRNENSRYFVSTSIHTIECILLYFVFCQVLPRSYDEEHGYMSADN